jgi:uncharacterized protein (TIGR00106 family)
MDITGSPFRPNGSGTNLSSGLSGRSSNAAIELGYPVGLALGFLWNRPTIVSCEDIEDRAGQQRAVGRGIARMNVMLDLCIVPVGVGVSLSAYVAACENVLAEAGLKAMLHAYGTNIEGDWDKVFAAIKRCHEVVHEMGAPRISTVIKLGTRTGRAQTLEDKVKSVQAKIAGR